MPRRTTGRMESLYAKAKRDEQLGIKPAPAQSVLPPPPAPPEPEQDGFSHARWQEAKVAQMLFRRFLNREPQRTNADRRLLQRIAEAMLHGDNETLEKIERRYRNTTPPLQPAPPRGRVLPWYPAALL